MKDKFLRINKSINTIMKKNTISYILIFLISLCIPSLLVLVKGNILNINNIVFNIIETILILIDIDLIILNIINKEYKYEHIFLNIIIPIGLLYLILLLPNYVPDEAAHSYRVYDISQGYIITRKNSDNTANIEVPVDLLNSLEINNYQELGKRLQNKTNYKEIAKVGDDGLGAANYPFVAYAFSAIAMKSCQIIGINILIAYYLARIVTLLISIAIIYYAIKKIPIGKIVILFYVFNPMFIQQLASISPDSIINSIALLFVAIVLNKLIYKEEINNIDKIAIVIITLLFAILKYTYLPLAFLLLLFFNKGRKKKNIKIIILLTVIILIAVLTYLYSGTYVSNHSYVIENEINSSEQIGYILGNPISYLITLLKTSYYNFEFYFYTLFGGELGQLNISINRIVPIIYAIILLITPFLEDAKLFLNKKYKKYFLLSCIFIYILIETGLYLVWTEVGGSIIKGVQGRYFLPIFFIIPLIIINDKWKIKFKYNKLFIMFMTIIINIISVLTIFNYFN